ncbi:hypothetical protein BO70DRAFT_367024 [Aspergillus heteromorphus CBS 117.55]|uniref:Uncharacterized protein n=1 Tax=Aspergillus heteromorphus CBS 117.55 TaxID=1448321 RepID=A0A317UWF8_9EURO|nr:uncharacterized protein BO70DRAFT_367024 [Aspergillus heteromorphus CBS 117.55]PWY64310.1 hypothetical protein BO70DRAFT_367024 [Aspergillus heteromorphus CBS 117.55]
MEVRWEQGSGQNSSRFWSKIRSPSAVLFSSWKGRIRTNAIGYLDLLYLGTCLPVYLSTCLPTYLPGSA